MDLDPALSEEALTILRRGAEQAAGRCFLLRTDSRPHRELLRDLEMRGFVRFIWGDWVVTDTARAAIGARSADEVSKDWYAAKMPPAAATAQAAKQSDPRSRHHYAFYKSKGYATFPAVKHLDNVKSIVVSRDGGSTGHVWLSKRILITQPESSGDLLLLTFPKVAARKVWREHRVDLLGGPVGLAADREWSLDERTAWEKLKRAAAFVNSNTARGDSRKPLLTRNQAA